MCTHMPTHIYTSHMLTCAHTLMNTPILHLLSHIYTHAHTYLYCTCSHTRLYIPELTHIYSHTHTPQSLGERLGKFQEPVSHYLTSHPNLSLPGPPLMEGPAVALGGAEPCWHLCLMALTQPQALPASGVHPLPPVPPHPPQDVLFGSMGTWAGRRLLGGDPGWAQGHCAGANSTVSRCFHSIPRHWANYHT